MQHEHESRGRPRRRWQLVGAAVVVAVALAVFGLASRGGSPRTHPPPPVSRPAPPATTPTTPTAPPTTTTPTAGPPAKPSPAAAQFGVNVNRLFNDRTYTGPEIDSQLQALQATGATIARSDALWEVTERAPPVGAIHHYDWSFDDLIAGSLAAHGLQWLPILDYSPAWSQAGTAALHAPPRAASDFAAFAAAFAARYGAGGTFWRARPTLKVPPVDTYEIWNEPDNVVFWSPAPDAAQYAELYLAARDAITAVDPAARVIVGGLTNAPVFLPAMLRSAPDLAGHVDGVAIHPYGQTPEAVLGRVRAARRVLSALGLATVPLYITEFGWITHPAHALNWVPEQRRPEYISRTLAELGHTNCDIAATVLYTWVTPERNPADREDWFGIHAPGGGGTADSAAFAAGLRSAAAPAPRLQLCSGG